jgi:hypothetical protein
MSHRESYPPRRSRPSWLMPILVAVVVSGIIIGASLLFNPVNTPATPVGNAGISPVTPAVRTPVAVPTSTWQGGDMPEGAIAGDGIYEVGTDVPIGKYKTSGPARPEVTGCYYARRRANADTPGDSLIDNARTAGQAVVTLKQNEVFETSGCNDWHRVP